MALHVRREAITVGLCAPSYMVMTARLGWTDKLEQHTGPPRPAQPGLLTMASKAYTLG